MVSQTLNPADHFTLMMDHEIRAAGLAGNFCGLVLELDSIPDRDLLVQRCRQFKEHYPRAVARLKHRGRQYAWHDDGVADLPFHIHTPGGDDAARPTSEQCIMDIINRPGAALEAPPVELHLIESTDTSTLLLRWFHPLCDARGAELLLYHLFEPDTPTATADQAVVQTLMNRWSLLERVKLAYQATRQIHQMDRQSSILPVASVPASPRLGMRLVTLDEQQSASIMSQAVRHTGMTGISLYFIGCLMRALDQTGSDPTGDAYCIPYAMNFRKSKALHPIFGNQISFLFAQAGRSMVQDRKALFAHLRDQSRQAIKSRLDYAMLPLMQLGSWLSLKKHGEIVRTSPHGRERSSMWFSYTGDMYPEPKQIAGCNVTGLYQLSPVTLPPGICLLTSRFAGRILLNYNFIEGCFSNEWLDALNQAMITELLGLEQDL